LTVPRRPRKATGMESVRTLDQAIGTAPKPLPLTLSGLLSPGRPLVMGVLNVTPDSFSDGGRFLDPTVAIAHAADMARRGAAILDIGAESTRPYGDPVPVSVEDEKARLAPVLPDVVKLGLPSRLRLRPGRSTRVRRSLTTSGACKRIRTWHRWWPNDGFR